MSFAHEVYRRRRVTLEYYPHRALQQAIRRRYHDGADGYATREEMRQFLETALGVGIAVLLSDEREDVLPPSPFMKTVTP